MSVTIKRNIVLLLVILALAFLLRAYGLSDESLWYDEGLSISHARLNVLGISDDLARKDTHPPLYCIILHYWMMPFGDSECSVRFLSVIFGTLAVLAIYKIAGLLFDRRTALISSLFMAISSFHIFFSQEARMYSLMSLLALFSMYFFLKLSDEKHVIYSIGYVIVTASLIYTHYAGFLLIFIQNIYTITLPICSKKGPRPNYKKWFGLQLMLVLLYLPWLAALVIQTYKIITNTTMKLAPSHLLAPPFNANLIKDSLAQCCGSRLLAYIFLALSFFSIADLRLKKLHLGPVSFNKTYFLWLWLLTPFFMPLFHEKFTFLLYFAKYMITSSPALYILAAKGLTNTPLRYLKIPTIALILALSLINTSGIYKDVNKEPWKEAVGYIDRNAREGDLVIFNPPYIKRHVFDYYNKRTDLDLAPFPPEESETTYVNEDNSKKLPFLLMGHDRVWFIQTHMHDPMGYILKIIKGSYRLVEDKKYDITSFQRRPNYYIGIRIYLFEKR